MKKKPLQETTPPADLETVANRARSLAVLGKVSASALGLSDEIPESDRSLRPRSFRPLRERRSHFGTLEITKLSAHRRWYAFSPESIPR